MIALLLTVLAQHNAVYPTASVPTKADHVYPGTGSRTIFYAPLDSNSLSLPWGSQDLPSAPDVEWFGSDPTGSGGRTSHTWTVTDGALDSVGTPFCGRGAYDDIDSSGCGDGAVFDGNDRLVSEAIAGGLGGTKISMVVVFLPSSGATNRDGMGTRDGVVADGWVLYKIDTPATDCRMFVDSSSGTGADASPTVTDDNWVVCGGTINTAGNIVAYANGVSNGGTAWIGGTFADPGDDIGFGRDPTWTAPYTKANYAYAAVWQDTELTEAEMQAIAAHIQGVYSPTAGAPTFNGSTTGPICCTVGGKLECYGDDWLPVGCEDFATGGGDGFTSVETQTNNLLYSRDLSTGWTQTGTSVVTCSQSSTPFRNTQRTTCKVTDDDGAGAEYISQTVDVTALAAGNFVQIQVFAAADSAQNIDIQVVEQTGASCSTTTTNFTTAAITSTWGVYNFEHTLLDGDCTDLVLRISPTDDITDTTATGHAYVIAQMGIDQNFQDPSPIYCETTSSTVSCGDMALTYPYTGDHDLGSIRYSLAVTNLHDGDGTPTSNIQWRADGASNIDQMLLSNSGRDPSWSFGGTTHLYPIATMSQGTEYVFTAVPNTANDTFAVRLGGVNETSTTASGTIGTLTDLDIGHGNGVWQGAQVIKQFRIQQ